jgi:diguanylate cyclase (GGDEF)-like protein/PAS domain S-box-containing protein
MTKPELDVLYSKVFHSAVVAIGVTNLEGYYILVNPTWCVYTGYTMEESAGITVRDVTPVEDRESSSGVFSRLVNGDIPSVRKIRRYQRKDGSTFWADLNASALTDVDGNGIGVIGVFTDIDRQVQAENRQKELNRELARLARHDPLTGLYNRRVLDELMIKEHKRSTRYKRGLAFAIADIDDFKRVNDTYGHDCGDQVLKYLTGIFLDSIRETDTVGRWGGEEFMFVFSETSCEGAEVVAERIRSAIANKPFVCGDISLKLSITIGFSYTHGDTSLQEIIKEADLALYRGKHSGKNRVVCYQDVCNDTM